MKENLRIRKTVLRTTKNIAFAMLLLISQFGNAQNVQRTKWTDFSRNNSSNFYEIQKDFNQYWAGKGVEKNVEEKGEERGEEGTGFDVFKRWENYVAPRVYPSGNLALISTTYSNFIDWQNTD